jgi:hypothetical protein
LGIRNILGEYCHNGILPNIAGCLPALPKRNIRITAMSNLDPHLPHTDFSYSMPQKQLYGKDGLILYRLITIYFYSHYHFFLYKKTRVIAMRTGAVGVDVSAFVVAGGGCSPQLLP